MSEQPIIVKKIKKTAAGHHGGSWKVAFADFMTAMMAFFLVMWIIGLDQETRSAIAGYFRDPVEFMKARSGDKMESFFDRTQALDKNTETSAAGFKKREEEREELEVIRDKVAKALSNDADLKELKKYVEVSVTDEGLKVEFLDSVGSVFFESGSSEVRAEARRLFTRLGQILGEAKHNIVVDGHTDSRPYASGSGENNWKLSQARAAATLDVLMKAGVRDNNVLACRGFADRYLRNPQNPYDFSNRRVSILLPYQWKERQVVGSGALSKPVQAIVQKPIGIAPRPESPK